MHKIYSVYSVYYTQKHAKKIYTHKNVPKGPAQKFRFRTNLLIKVGSVT